MEKLTKLVNAALYKREEKKVEKLTVSMENISSTFSVKLTQRN